MILAAVLLGAVLVKAQAPPAQQAPVQQTQAPAGNAETGKKLFASIGCYQCHGYEGQGGSAGPRIAPRPIAYQAFLRYLRKPTNQMPPFTEKVVTDADLANIYAYLQSRPMPQPAANIPLLQK
jgi:mono/diheme cytochrome c family protein